MTCICNPDRSDKSTHLPNCPCFKGTFHNVAENPSEKAQMAVVCNIIPEERTGKYLLVLRTSSRVMAFGLSTTDAIRAQRMGIPFVADAKKLLEGLDQVE